MPADKLAMPETPYERLQRQTAERLAQSVMPHMARILEDVQKQLRPLVQIDQILAPQYRGMLERIAESFQRVDIPRVQIPTFEIPTLKLDYNSLFPDLAAVQAEAGRALQSQIQVVFELQREQFAQIIASARSAYRSALPPNWRDDSIVFPNDLEQMLLDEGLPLAWVPPTSILRRLFSASSGAERRRILGGSWKPVTKACLVELDEVADTSLSEHVRFAQNAARLLLLGESSGSQALSANLLDSILRAEFDKSDRVKITGKVRPSIDEYPLRVGIVVGAIWGAHGEFWGGKVPRRFSRHASVHGVSRQQYSRINAVLALMHVVALLRLIDTDFR